MKSEYSTYHGTDSATFTITLDHVVEPYSTDYEGWDEAKNIWMRFLYAWNKRGGDNCEYIRWILKDANGDLVFKSTKKYQGVRATEDYLSDWDGWKGGKKTNRPLNA